MAGARPSLAGLPEGGQAESTAPLPLPLLFPSFLPISFCALWAGTQQIMCSRLWLPRRREEELL